MRKQYHFRPSAKGFYAWDVHRLVELSSSIAPKEIELDRIGELDEAYWFQNGAVPTCRVIAGHFRLMMDADLGCPVILCAEGRLMDGMHRVTKAFAFGLASIPCVQFDETPPPDFVDVRPEDLPY